VGFWGVGFVTIRVTKVWTVNAAEVPSLRRPLPFGGWPRDLFGAYRMVIPIIIFGWLLLLGFAAADGWIPAPKWLVATIAVGCLASLLLALSCARFAKPQRLVPPALRQ
jgi:hypothetical protein